MTWQLLAAGEPRLAAAVPFYGPFPAGASLAGSPNAAVLGIYAGLDDRVNGTDATRPRSRSPRPASPTSCGCSTGSTTPSSTTPAHATTRTAAGQAHQAMLDWFGQHLAV